MESAHTLIYADLLRKPSVEISTIKEEKETTTVREKIDSKGFGNTYSKKEKEEAKALKRHSKAVHQHQASNKNIL